MPAPTGKQGMDAAKKRAFRLASMTSNRKRDKARQRSNYHHEFDNAPGLAPLDRRSLGFTILPRAEVKPARIPGHKA